MAKKKSNKSTPLNTPDVSNDFIAEMLGFEPDAEMLPEETVTEIDNEDGTVTLEIAPEEDISEEDVPAEYAEHNANLAMFLPEEELQRVEAYCTNRFDQDKASLDDYFSQIAKGIKRLGLTIEELNDPFPGAAAATHPIILEAALKTQAKITGEVFSGKGLIDTYIKGAKTPERQEIANQVKNHMDNQFLFEMKEYVTETERMAFRYALTGNAFRKFYYCPIRDRIVSSYVTEDKLICNMGNSSLAEADFHTEIIPMKGHEFEHMIQLGEYVDVLEGANGGKLAKPDYSLTQLDDIVEAETYEPLGGTERASSEMEVYELHEHHLYWKLPSPYNDGETRPLPYVVTIESNSGKVISMRRNWKKQDAKKQKRIWYAHYRLVPGLGFLGMGYIHLLSNFQYALTQIIRSLLDAGQFANLKGGFKARAAARLTRDTNVPIRMGEWKDIDTGSRPIRDVVYPLDYGEPSQVLERLITTLSNMAQKFADSTENIIADSTNYGPVGTTVALLEASGKFISGIQKRFYQGLQQEFEIVHDLNYDILEDEQEIEAIDSSLMIKREYYSGKVGIVPLADPNVSSSAHRIALAQTKLAAAEKHPQQHNMRQALMDFYTAIGMEKAEIDMLLPAQEEAQPLDPLSDIQALANGKPIKAFPGQDHDAHIKFKEAFLNDPQGGGSPSAAGIVPLIQANIAEHQLLKYVASVQGAAQANGMDLGAEMDIALAAERALEANTVMKNMEALMAKDPSTLLALAEYKNAETREKELEYKTIDNLIDHETRLKELSLKQQGQLLTAISNFLRVNGAQEQAKLRAGTDMVKQALTSVVQNSAEPRIKE